MARLPAWLGEFPNWPALLVAPSLALGNLSVVYALVTPSCALQTTTLLHVLSAIALMLCLLLSLPPFLRWRRRGGHTGSDDPAVRDRFMALIAWVVGALSAFMVLAQWLPVWVLSPCFA
jgi:hypothetical protein